MQLYDLFDDGVVRDTAWQHATDDALFVGECNLRQGCFAIRILPLPRNNAAINRRLELCMHATYGGFTTFREKDGKGHGVRLPVY